MAKEKIMYAVFRKEKSKHPETIHTRYRDAKQEMMSNQTFWWGKGSYIQRVVVRKNSQKVIDTFIHQRVTK